MRTFGTVSRAAAYDTKADSVGSVAISPGSGFVAVGTSAGTVEFWTAAGQLVGSVSAGHVGPVTGVDFNADGSVLFTVGADGLLTRSTVAVVDGALTVTGTASVVSHGVSSTAIALSADDTVVVTGGADRIVAFWDAVTLAKRVDLPAVAVGDRVNDLVVSPSWKPSVGGESVVAVALQRDGFKVLRDGSPVFLGGEGNGNATSLRFIDDGRSVVGGSKTGELTVWPVGGLGSTPFGLANVGPVERIASGIDQEGALVAVAATQDGHSVVTITDPASTSGAVVVQGSTSPIRALTIADNGATVAFGDSSGNLFIVPLTDRKPETA